MKKYTYDDVMKAAAEWAESFTTKHLEDKERECLKQYTYMLNNPSDIEHHITWYQCRWLAYCKAAKMSRAWKYRENNLGIPFGYYQMMQQSADHAVGLEILISLQARADCEADSILMCLNPTQEMFDHYRNQSKFYARHMRQVFGK